MIKYSLTHEKVLHRDHEVISIPAFLQDGQLQIGRNGSSDIFVQNKIPEDFDPNKIIHWKDCFYVYDNKSVWKLTNVIAQHKDLVCSYLTNASADTYLCRCNDCGEKFVIDNYESVWYSDKGFKIPRRCKSCRDKKKKVENI